MKQRGFTMSLWDRHPLAVNYQTVKDLGYQGTLEDLISVFHGCHDLVYETSPITPGIVELIDYLHERGFKLGVVSASANDWIETVLNKLKRRDSFNCLVSLNKHPVLKTKPAPDGYLHAMETLGVTPDQTVILEDSQAGVTAAKQSGALTICFTGLHPNDYLVEGADVYLQSIALVRDFIQSKI